MYSCHQLRLRVTSCECPNDLFNPDLKPCSDFALTEPT